MTPLLHLRALATLLAAVVTPLLIAQARPNAQGASSYQGFRLPTVGGTLSYSATLAGNVTRGYYGVSGVTGYTSISGNFALLTESKRHPFSMVYSGGYFANVTGDGTSNVFQNLALSQVLTTGRWSFTVADSVSYLPQTATTGISGVPGVGDTGTAPVDVGTGTSLGVLTLNQSRVSNTLIGSAQRRLTPSTSLTGTASYGIARYLDTSVGSALNNDQYTAGLSLSHRLDARNTLGATYSYLHFSYPGVLDPSTLSAQTAFGAVSSLSSQSVTADYSRLVNRRLSVFVSAGPQWTSIPSSSAAPGTTGTGTSVNVAVNAGLTYTARAATFSANYARGTNTGSGIVTGATSDSVTGTASRRFTRVWTGSASAGYSRSSSLVSIANDPFVSNTLFASGQVSRSVGRHLSAFGSYTAQRQADSGLAATTAAYSGLSQTIAAGLTYSPGVIGRNRR